MVATDYQLIVTRRPAPAAVAAFGQHWRGEWIGEFPLWMKHVMIWCLDR